MNVWCWGLTSHQTGRLSNDMWHVPWCHHQRQAPQADGRSWWLIWLHAFYFPSPLAIVLLQSLFCRQLAGRMLAARPKKTGCLYLCLQDSPMEHPAWQGPPSTLLQREGHLISPKCHAGKYSPSPPAWPALSAKMPKYLQGSPSWEGQKLWDWKKREVKGLAKL